MKKILTVLLAVLMVLCLAGCAKEEAAPEEETVTAKGVYFVTNNTGANVGAVYIYPVGGSRGTNYVEYFYDKGDLHYNYIQQFHGITIDASVDPQFAEWTGVEAEKPHFVFEFENTDGDLIGTFDNLALEEATIVLISEDMRTGATEIAWGGKDYNEYTMAVNFYNHTGSTVTSLKAVDSATGEEVADILAECGVENIADKNEEAVVWTHTEDLATANTRHYNIMWETEDGQVLSLVSDGYAAHALSFENTDMVLRNADVCTGATTVWWIAGMAED